MTKQNKVQISQKKMTDFYTTMKSFHSQHGVETHWFPIKLEVKPVVPEKIEHGEIKMAKDLKSIRIWKGRDTEGKSIYEGHPLYFQGQKKSKKTGETYDDFMPTQSDWDRFTPEQILARQELMLDPVWRNQFTHIAMKTDTLKHIDLDCPLYHQDYSDLFKTHPYYKSATKSFGAHIIFTSDFKSASKRNPKLINDVESDIPQDVELLDGQWSYLPIGTEIFNIEQTNLNFDISKYVMQTLNDVKISNKKIKSTSVDLSMGSTETEVYSYSNDIDQTRELVSLITCSKKDGRNRWQCICDAMKANGLVEGDWLSFCKNNGLNLDKEKLNYWDNCKGDKEIFYLHKLAKESDPQKHADFVTKYNISLVNPQAQKYLDDQEKLGLIVDADQIRQTTKYKNAKAILEQKIFKLEAPLRYVNIDASEDSGEIWFYKEKQLDFYCRGNRDFPDIMMGGKRLPFVNFWHDDIDHRVYTKMVFETNPSKFNPKNYNLFTGFSNDKGQPAIKETESHFLRLLSKHCQEPEIYEFFKCWIAHMIQRPWEKSGIAMVLYSKLGGVGKNCLVDGIKAIIGKKYTGQLQSIKDITKDFNAHLCNKIFIYGDEVCSKAKEMTDFLKNVVTRTECSLEKKGVDAITVNDQSNYMFTTNNEHCFKTDETDRRLNFIRCVEERLSSDDSIAFYEEINDPIKVQQLFEFFKTYEQVDLENIPRFRIGQGQAAPVTQYKKELIFEDRKPFIAMLYKEPMTFIEQRISSTTLHKMAVEYARKNFMSPNFTITEMGTAMKKYLGAIKKRTKLGHMFDFPKKIPLMKILHEADEPYYRYVFQLEEDEEPSFDE
jgi:hypothetical protein